MSERILAALGLLALLAAPGCLKKDYPEGALVVSDVALEGGGRVVSRDDVLAGLATAASPRFLGIWDGVVFEYEVFDDALLERDLERIERYFRARGYYEARVTAARVIRQDDHRVRVEIRIREGLPVLIAGDVTIEGIERLPFDAAMAADRARRLERGQHFDEAVYESTKRAIVTSLANDGYAFAKITGAVHVDLSRREARITFTVHPGPRAVYGPIRIVGLDKIPEDPVRGNLNLVEGARYSRADLEDAKTALVNLGVFATVDVGQDLARPESGRVPVTVTVREAPLRTLRMGGGTRFDVLEWSSHLTIGWEHRNFMGGMRRFVIETRPGVVFFPTRTDNFELPSDFLPKNRVRAELRQPAFLEGRTVGLLGAEFNVYPVLYPGLGEQPGDRVLGYQEVKTRAGVERPFFSHAVYVSPSYNWQADVPFAYLGENDLDTVFISYPELRAVLDLRDSPIEPHRGVFLSGTAQLAGHGFGGDAADVKVQPEIRTYVPISKTVTFATRAMVGLLFPENYGGSLVNTGAAVDDGDALRDQQLLLLRAFYSGGPNSNRGYGFRGVGPHGLIRFLVPSTANCRTSDPACFRPTGGLTLWEASAEARFPVIGPLRGALFVDASDVSTGITDFRSDFPHLSPGFGLRYATPVGPVRLDIGYRMPFAQQLGEESLPPEEGQPGTILDLPIAIHFGLGEAF